MRARRLLTVLAGTALVLVLVRAIAAEPVSVTTGSMAPTLRAGDHVLVGKLAYRFADPARGELIVLREPQSGALVVKRVVALEGDRVAIEDGVLHVNGRSRREPYVDTRRIDSAYYGPVQVPRHAVFVMGDRREDSVDSRDFGPVDRSRILGRVEARVWPPGRAGGW